MSDAGAGTGPTEGPVGSTRRSVASRSKDEAVGQVIEAMLIGALVLGAVGFAVAFKAPPPPSADLGSENLRDKTWDAVDALNNMHYPDAAYGNSTLSKIVADAAANKSSSLKQALESFMPVGSQFQIHLNNGYDRIPLYTNQTATGQTVGVAYPFEPNWKYHYGRTDLRLYNTNASNIAMGVNLVPLYNSNLVQDQGQYVEARVDGEQSWAPGLLQDEDLDDVISGTTNVASSMNLSFREDSYTTLVQGDDQADYPSASVYLGCARDGGSAPCYAIDLTSSPTPGYGPHVVELVSGTVTSDTTEAGIAYSRLDVTVANDGPGALPEGTDVEVFFPVGMDVRESIGDPNNAFRDIQNLGNEPHPERVEATLDTALADGETAELHVWVARNDTRYAYKHIHARMSGGASSSSQILSIVDDKSPGTYTGGDTRVTLVSSPRPAGSGSDAHGRWAIVMPTPFGQTKIDSARLSITEGDGHFTNVDWPEDFNPTWPASTVKDGSTLQVVDASTIEWTKSPAHETSGYSFIELQFNVSTDGEHTRASPDFPGATPEVEFQGFDPSPQYIQIEPGIWWKEHPPDSQDEPNGFPGYGASGADPSPSDPIKGYNASNTIDHRSSTLTGDTPYQLVDLGDATVGNSQAALEGGIKDAMHAAKLSHDPQRVTPGETMNITVDTRDIGMFLSETVGVNSLNASTEIYPPWGIRNLTPIETFDHRIATALVSAPAAIKAAYLNGNQAQDLIVASTDGTIYGLNGPDGETITSRTFAVPASDEADERAEPNILTRTMNPGVGQIYGVGTTAGTDKWYSLDANLEQRWAAEKPENTVETLALNTSMDITGDGVPDFIASTSTAGNSDNPYGRSRLNLYDGADGSLVAGWTNQSTANENGIRVNGTPESVGFGNWGSQAKGGIFASTGKQVGTKLVYQTNATLDDFTEGDTDGITDTLINVSIGVKDSGLVGRYADGTKAWNFTGGRFDEVQRADRMDLGKAPSTGRPYSGLIGTGADGWVYGFNGSQPMVPSDGFTTLGYTSYDDVAMANEVEGYKVSKDGVMFGTRDGWTTKFGNGINSQYLTNLNAVDTPDGPPYSGYGNVSWWAGDAGVLFRSDDRLKSRTNLTGTANLAGVLSTDATTVLQDPLDTTQNLDLADVNFHDVVAVSTTEAWIVGEGAAGTPISDYGYIVHATEKGQTLDAYRLECYDSGSLLSGCGLKAIDADGDRLWVAGDYGTVLVQDAMGQSAEVDLVGSGGVNGNGILPVELSSSSPVQIRNVTVNWEPFSKFDWMRGTTLNDASGNPDLWNESSGEPYMEGPTTTTYSSDKGAARDATLYVKQYTNNVAGSSDSDRQIDGTATLMVGPFKKTLLPTVDGYYGQSWYENSDDELLDPDNLPITFQVNVTYEDGTADTYQITLEDDGTVSTREIAGIDWVAPSELGFTGPATCFGYGQADCGTYHSLNFSANDPDGLVGAIVGDKQTLTNANQAPLLRMDAGTDTFERVWDPRINKTVIHDVAINPDDPDRWLLVGPDTMLARTFDAGHTFTVLPTLALYGEGTGMPLLATDYTHPTNGIVVGGSGEGLHWYAGGYREGGTVETDDLWSGPTGETLEKVDFDTDDIRVSANRHGTATATVEIWDPGLDGGAGGWATVHEEETWDASYTYTQPTDDVRLRFDMTTAPGFTVNSPQVRGHLNLSGYTDETQASDVTLSLDLNDTAAFDSDTLPNLDQSAEHGYLRLNPAENEWLVRLGNYEKGDWADQAGYDKGARPHDMAFSPDGNTVFVGTGGIYEWAAAPEGAPVGYDNTLYAFDVKTGTPASGWDLVRFEDPIRKISVGEDTVYVLTAEAVTDGNLENASIHRVLRSSGDVTKEIEVTSLLGDTMFTIFDGFLDTAGSDEDLAVAMVGEDGDDGKVLGFSAPALDERWNQNPSVNGHFEEQYELPPSAMYGTYVTVTEVDWTISDDFGNEIVQTGRIHDSFHVTPPTKRIPLSPTYNLEVVAWMEDWG